VFYLPGTDIGNVLAERLAALGHPAVEPENPYWHDLGAVTSEDPDGCAGVARVVDMCLSAGGSSYQPRNPLLEE